MSITVLERFLARHDDPAWRKAAYELQLETHEVDRTAVAIWLAFYPLSLRAAVEAEGADQVVQMRRLSLQGLWRLEDHLDTAHRFFYGHRYWPTVRRLVVDLANRMTDGPAGPLPAVIREVAHAGDEELRLDRQLLTGISLVALHTLQHVGLPALAAARGEVHVAPRDLARPPGEVLRTRRRDDHQGLFGFLRGDRRRYTVTFDEHDPEGRFALLNTQAITTAAAADPRDWRARDPRCTEGPIPVQCRSASCGTCWVGVLAGAEKLSAVESRERHKLREFGYADTDEPHPVIRLACQAHAGGAITIVIPPWNGVFGQVAGARPEAGV